MTYLHSIPNDLGRVPVETSWPVHQGAAHYRTPNGIYAPLGLTHDASPCVKGISISGMQARFFRAQPRCDLIGRAPLDIHYLAGQSRAQKAKATIVRIPGLGSNVHIDNPIDPALIENHNVIAIDLPGCGLSPWLTDTEDQVLSPRAYEAMPEQVNGVAKAIALSIAISRVLIDLVNHQTRQWQPAPVILCGHSMGALISQLMLSCHEVFPETINNISGGILLNAFASDGELMPAHWYLDMMAHKIQNTHEYKFFPVTASVLLEWLGVLLVLAYFSQNRSLGSLTNVTRRTMFTHMPREGLEPTFLRDRFYAQTLQARMIHGSLGNAETQRLMQEIQKKVAVPVAVLLGERDPLAPAERMRAAFTSSIPRCDVHIVAGAGHMLPQDDPHYVQKWITDQVRKMLE